LVSFRKRLNKALAEAEKVHRKHYTCDFHEFDDSSFAYSYNFGPSDPWWYPQLLGCKSTMASYHEPSRFHMEVEYSYSYFRFQTEYAQILGLLDALGVNFNPAIIWRAIPWTFVIDWVVGIGRLLDSTRVKVMDPVIVIHRCVWSVSRKRRILCSHGVNVGSAFGAAQMYTQPLPTVIETAYRRSVVMPSRSSFTTSGLSPDEVVLGSALAIGHIRRALKRKLRWKS
jgi:hypothetical protein